MWPSLLATMNREGAPSETHHAKVDHDDSFAGTGRHSVAIAQRAGLSTNPDKQLRLLADAPAGHRQPRADQVPSDKMDPSGIMILKGLTLPPRE